ncbi:uncharacterized protein LOC114733251 [Neltuma alba]|uniref:uncharacterized protein LOC114733251 n=1 Tax=Neltuma alba TaxID=207710 RepID=UPI0010A476BC|nr:uncharacterized protein LOC114733251 [Prosopis alba]
MQMQRNLGFQQQCYGTGTQQGSYGVHEETWSSRNGHHNQFPGKRMTNGAYVDSHDYQMHLGMFKEGHHGPSGHHGHFAGGHTLPFGGPTLFSNGPKHSHQPGHGRDYFSEVNRYEMQNSAGKVKVDEMRYERHNWGGGNGGFSANPYDRNMNNGVHKFDWQVKGV